MDKHLLRTLPCARFLVRNILFDVHFYFDVRFVFASNCHDSGVLTDTEWYMYCDWHTFLTDTLPVKLDGIVYLLDYIDQV